MTEATTGATSTKRKTPVKTPNHSGTASSTSADEIYRELKQRILTDQYAPGQKLSENSLAEEFERSRTPIRDVLKRLENDGLIEIRPKSGTYVRNETEQDVIELLQVRAYLESLAFRLCLHHITDREVSAIRRVSEKMDALTAAGPPDMMKYALLHYQLHHALIRGSRNHLLKQIFERLNFRYSHVFFRGMSEDRAAFTQREHARIVDYLERRDPAGIEFMERHLWGRLHRVYGVED